eukprot:gene6434-3063_t
MAQEMQATATTATTKSKRRAVQEQQRAEKAAASINTECATELLVVRHGETSYNVEGRLQSETAGTGLNSIGFAQAAKLAEALAAEHLDALYSSDLIRARQTADAISQARGGPEVFFSDALRERHLGDVQGYTNAEAKEKQPEAFQALFHRSWGVQIPGGGESRKELQQRVVAEVERIAAKHIGQRVLLLSHGGAINTMHRWASSHSAGLKIGNCSVSVFLVEGKTWVSKGSYSIDAVSEITGGGTTFGGSEGEG